jgi:hypothetical protein
VEEEIRKDLERREALKLQRDAESIAKDTIEQISEISVRVLKKSE